MHIRRYEEADRSAVLALAPRLTEGVAPWRSPEGVLAAVIGWVVEALHRAGEPGRFVFVAEDGDDITGFVAGEQRAHWSGDRELYVGELVVAQPYEGRGIGRALMEAVTDHARQQGLRSITLDTGAANTNARTFYNQLGFEEEDVKLTKRLS
ncbi:phosphinothricin acetyltransferase [Kribbella pratensis]|jgi:ribosomal protein S18 acetylase RimI-like enzyme|uniref:Phosphinothricin acetyltransferase n=1 Tax=Kribbella pratensis TaxID=2512112 RepID=A0ABY2F4J6_9ACTN|nr:GNAT family N-acetyltransferase [Kribbella pratensis]TDW81464.1 phosphinothricin acetyltransferase [Kribbella pratensis]